MCWCSLGCFFTLSLNTCKSFFESQNYQAKFGAKMVRVSERCNQLYDDITKDTPLTELLPIAKDTAAFISEQVAEGEANRHELCKMHTNGVLHIYPNMYDMILKINRLFLAYLKHGNKEDQDKINHLFDIFRNDIEIIIDRLVSPQSNEDSVMPIEKDHGSNKNDDVMVACAKLKHYYDDQRGMCQLVYRLRKRIKQQCKA